MDVPYLCEPLVGFAGCDSPMLAHLAKVVMPGHEMPEDILSDPKIIISYFLPFKKKSPCRMFPGSMPLENGLHVMGKQTG